MERNYTEHSLLDNLKIVKVTPTQLVLEDGTRISKKKANLLPYVSYRQEIKQIDYTNPKEVEDYYNSFISHHYYIAMGDSHFIKECFLIDKPYVVYDGVCYMLSGQNTHSNTYGKRIIDNKEYLCALYKDKIIQDYETKEWCKVNYCLPIKEMSIIPTIEELKQKLIIHNKDWYISHGHTAFLEYSQNGYDGCSIYGATFYKMREKLKDLLLFRYSDPVLNLNNNQWKKIFNESVCDEITSIINKHIGYGNYQVDYEEPYGEFSLNGIRLNEVVINDINDYLTKLYDIFTVKHLQDWR